MLENECNTEKPAGDFITQDGCRCPAEPPWHPMVSRVTAVPIIVYFIIAALGMIKVGFLPFLLWFVLAAIKVYGIRYYVCARCPYYGKDCSSFFGRLVPLMHKKQENRSMVTGLKVDTLFWAILFFYPLYHFLKNGMMGFTLVYCFWFFMMVGVLTRLACTVCPLTICPVGQMGRRTWKLFGVE
jgi:hypothetical protein